jgi:hypothetical protein
MKSFSNFLSEASGAAQQAKRLGLEGDGHGGWYKHGEFVAKTEGGKLKFYNKRQRPGQDPPQTEKEKNNPNPSSAPADTVAAKPQAPPAQTSAPQPQAQPQGNGGEEGLDGEGPPTEDLGTLTVSFGRFNPPTIGHQKLMNKAKSVAGKDGEYRIYPSRTHDPKKNPLDPDTKISVMRQMYPDHSERIQNDAGARNIFDVLKKAHNDGYTSMQIVVGADRQAEFEKLATAYNGKFYDFKNLSVISAGDRDPDSEGVEGMSASKMRKAAAEDDYDTFRNGVPKGYDDKSTKQLFTTLRKNMKVSEGWNLWQIAPKFDWKNLRENYVRKAIFKVGDLVENVNSGLIGRVMRRGTNYLICVTESDVMFKSWIYDLSEYSEVHMKNRMRDKKHPNTLIGTSGHRKNTQDFVDGQKKIGNFNIKEFINRYRKN